MNNFFSKISDFEPNFLYYLLVSLIIFLLIITFLIALIFIVRIISWFLFFFIFKKNSTNKNTHELAEEYIKKNGIRPELLNIQEIKIKPSWFYIFPYSVREGALNLRMWKLNYGSYSLHSVAYGLEKTYLISGKQRFKQEVGYFSSFLYRMWKPIAFFIPIALFSSLIFNFFVNGNKDFLSFFYGFLFSSFGLFGCIFWTSLSWWQVNYRFKMRKEVLNNISGIFSGKDKKVISFLLTLKFIWDLLIAIFYSIELMIRLIIFISELFYPKK
jgi:hypothetical protein